MPAQISYRFFIILIFILMNTNIVSQQIPYLEKKITLKISNQKLSDVFKSITAQTGVLFSYTAPFNDKQLTTINCYKKPLRLVLSEILKPSNCTYKVKDKYIIIKCDATSSLPPAIISGYVLNIKDSTIIKEASVYIKQTKNSTLTNTYGYFSLSYSKTLPSISLSVAKEYYLDTNIVIYNQKKQEVLIYLFPKQVQPLIQNKITTEIPIDSVRPEIKERLSISPNPPFRLWKKLFYINPNLRNISDTIFSDVSLSFLPYISTNRLLSINTVTKYSFNILAGYSKGIDIFELGGLVNIDNGNVKYGQIGGLGNIVAGEFTGGQVGGIFNINSKNITGVQIAGIVNVDKSNIRGLQIGGIGNVVSNNTTGVQIGGVFNLTKNQFKGVQLAGIYNFTDTLKGLQLAGIINSVNTSNGIQVAGILNHSTLLNGVQFSLLNFSDTATASGIPFGLFSYVKNGYHKLELATDELLFGTLSFGTGVDRLYNIFITGINYSKPTFYTFGYGLGSNYHLKNKWSLSINLTAQQIQSFKNNEVQTAILNKLFMGFEYSLRPKLRMNIGPSMNIFITDTTNNDYNNMLDQLAFNPFYNHTEYTTNIKIWAGAKIAVKFF